MEMDHMPRILCDGSSDPNLEPTCGRPLGIKFNRKTCELYIADAYFGLLKVGPNGGVAQQLATSAEGIPFCFTNGLDIDTQNGVVYFTDSSMVYQRRAFMEIIPSGDETGRLMKYDPITKKVTVLLQGLACANGVALSEDNSFLLVAETATKQILRLWLQGPKAYVSELFAHLERPPDNIKTNDRGEFWIALNSGRDLLQNLQKENKMEGQILNPWLIALNSGKDSLQNLDGGNKLEVRVLNPWLSRDPVGIKFNTEGMIVEVLDGNGGSELSSVSEVNEYNGSLWIGSVQKYYVCVIQL
ncbi:hypothetical protein FNV43_RR26985 [Rhamnella rubrinervis]|uniref:Strictosidine synthase conserved region domain-containing protein n=1 Tax=Rhamnella rubrinervis TaxID=2594499 RepID=A0A8K0DKT0_9ROSA|nr:hypothetical protein FNV43_RR26985 [Rhamnella rubrinervis]